jgi:hypothetical protein
MPAARLRGTNWLYFYANKDENIEFEIVWQRVANYTDPVRIGLVSPTGTHLNEGTATKDQSFLLQTAAPMNGVYGLVVMSVNGANAAYIVKVSHHYTVHIAHPRGAGFVYKLPPLFVSVVRNAAAVELEFVTDGGVEAVLGTVLANNGLKLWSGVIDGPTKVRIDKPVGSYLELRFDKIPGRTFEDIGVRGLQGVFPFVATHPAGLLSR